EFLKEDVHTGEFLEGIEDIIAAVHLLDFPLKDKERMGKSLQHFQAMVKHSRQIFEFAEKESDNDREWIPNPRQQSVLGEGVISAEMLTTWREFLVEADDILTGKKLVPFWRNAGGKGVNIHKVFTEPRDLDIILWVQGTDAAPYLEAGNVTKK